MRHTPMLSEMKYQIRRLRPTLSLVWIASFLVLGVIAACQIWGDIPINHLTRDVTAVAKLPAWIGALSSLGIVLWSAAAALCFFTGTMTRRGHNDNSLSAFFHCAGGVTTLLLLDDLFQIHENAPDLFGISEDLFLGIYVVLIFLFIVIFERQILRTDFALFALALGIFGVSLVADVLPATEQLRDVAAGLDYLLEDGAKFVGICFWLAYFAHASAWALQTDAAEFKGE